MQKQTALFLQRIESRRQREDIAPECFEVSLAVHAGYRSPPTIRFKLHDCHTSGYVEDVFYPFGIRAPLQYLLKKRVRQTQTIAMEAQAYYVSNGKQCQMVSAPLELLA